MAQQQDKANDQGTHQSSTGPAARTFGADDIARRAYQRFLERGGQHGHDMDDWFEAERELRQRDAGKTATPPHGDELAAAPERAPVAPRTAAPTPKSPKGPSRGKRGTNGQRPDRASDQE